jgi:tetratricopeptide (TPR) repeat protein
MEPYPPGEQALAARFIESERKENAGDGAAAAAILEKIWGEQPQTPYGQEAKFWLACLKREAGNTPAAAAHYRELLKATPDGTLARRALISLGELAEQAGRFDDAHAYYAQAAGETADEIAAKAHLRQALCWLKQKSHAQAAVEFRKVVDTQAVGAERVVALLGGADCYEQLGRPCDAMRLYRYLSLAYGGIGHISSARGPDAFKWYFPPAKEWHESLDIRSQIRSKLESLKCG